MIGFAFDGTGYGSDGAVWGGEVLLADYKGYQRLASLKYVPLAGGDVSVLRPYRMALAHLWAAGIAWDADLAPVRRLPARRAEGARAPAGDRPGMRADIEHGPAVRRGVRRWPASATSSTTRRRPRSSWKGMSRGSRLWCSIRIPSTSRRADVIDPVPVLTAVIDDARAGAPAGVIGARFHHAVADLIVELAGKLAESSRTVALSGGVFQNALLLNLALRGLRDSGFHVITHRVVPPNDGGIALGQLLVGNSG